MSKNVKVFARLSKSHHSQRTFNVALDSLIEPSVEVNASCAIHNHIALFLDLQCVLCAHPEPVTMQIALSEIIIFYTWVWPWCRWSPKTDFRREHEADRSKANSQFPSWIVRTIWIPFCSWSKRRWSGHQGDCTESFQAGPFRGIQLCLLLRFSCRNNIL